MIPGEVKKTLRIILLFILIGVALYLVVSFSISVTGLGEPGLRDVKRMRDIAEIERKMERYFDEYDSEYPKSFTVPTSIDGYVVPRDYQEKPYNWIDNTSEPQKFCVWAKFERKSGYVIASHCGYKETTQQPTSLDECCELTRP